MKTKGIIVLIVLGIAMALFVHLRHRERTVLEVQQSGDATITVTGQDVENM